MLLIIENDKALLLEERTRFFRRFAISTCGASFGDYKHAFDKFPVDAVFIPHIEEADDPITFCRALKQAHPRVPLVTPVKLEECKIDLDALYAVTDNIPVYPLTFVQMGEIICELQRMYTGRDYLSPTHGSLMLSIYTSVGIYDMCTFDINVHENAILRYLWIAQPRHVGAKELAAAACCPTRNHTVPYVLSIIASINRRSRSISTYDLVLSDEEGLYFIGPRS